MFHSESISVLRLIRWRWIGGDRVSQKLTDPRSLSGQFFAYIRSIIEITRVHQHLKTIPASAATTMQPRQPRRRPLTTSDMRPSMNAQYTGVCVFVCLCLRLSAYISLFHPYHRHLCLSLSIRLLSVYLFLTVCLSLFLSLFQCCL